MNVVKIRKSGTFYQVFDLDSYIIYYLFDYKIRENKVGFPRSALNKVLNRLEELKITYEVIGESQNNFKNLNKYKKYLELGKKKYNKEIQYQNIMEKLKNIKEEKLDKILEAIEEILDE